MTNAQAIEALYTSFSARLKQFILKRVHDEAAAEDILQDVFLKIHTGIDSLKDESKVESWIYQIARNAIIDFYRNKRTTLPNDQMPDIPDEIEELTAAERLTPSVREFVEQLPEPYREALKLVEYEGISQKELAERIGISFSGAKSRVQRARAMLRDLLMQCCHFEFDQYGTIIDYHPIACSCCSETRK